MKNTIEKNKMHEKIKEIKVVSILSSHPIKKNIITTDNNKT